jgi:hypothetical protein
MLAGRTVLTAPELGMRAVNGGLDAGDDGIAEMGGAVWMCATGALVKSGRLPIDGRGVGVVGALGVAAGGGAGGGVTATAGGAAGGVPPTGT